MRRLIPVISGSLALLVLVAAILLTAMKKTFTESELISNVEIYLTHLIAQGARFADTLLDPVPAVRSVLQAYVDDKFLEKEPNRPSETSAEETRFRIIETKRPHLEYYKNNCIHFFNTTSRNI